MLRDCANKMRLVRGPGTGEGVCKSVSIEREMLSQLNDLQKEVDQNVHLVSSTFYHFLISITTKRQEEHYSILVLLLTNLQNLLFFLEGSVVYAEND